MTDDGAVDGDIAVALEHGPCVQKEQYTDIRTIIVLYQCVK